MSRFRILIAAVLLAALLAGATGCKRASDDSALPADLLALLPADPTVVISLSSLDDWEVRRQALADSTGGPPLLPGGALAEIDLAAIFAEQLPAAAAVAATDRPLVLAVGLPAPLTNQLDVVFVFPVAGDTEVGELADGEPFRSQLSSGKYLALATSAAYTPADSVPALARDRLPGLVSVAVDLEGVVAMYRPLVVMGLAAMAAMPPHEDTDGPAQVLTPAEAAALAKMTGDLMDSVRRQDLALDLDDEELDLAWRLDLIPGSPLDPGPQPDFARALALTGALPADAPVKMAAAVDQTRQVDVFSDYYLAAMGKDLARLPEDLARGIEEWFTGYLETYGYVNVPLASSAGIGPEGVDLTMILAAADPAGLREHFARQLTILGNLGVGLTVTAVEDQDLGGVAVHGWHLDWDDAVLTAIVAQADSAQVAPTGGELLQTMNLLRRLTPDLWLAEVGELLVLTTTTDDTELAARLAAVQAPSGPDPQLAALAKAGGEHTIEVFRGDVAQILAMVFEVMHDADPELTAELRSRPMAVTGVATLDGPRVGFGGTVDVAGLRSTVATVKHLLAQLEQKHAGHD